MLNKCSKFHLFKVKNTHPYSSSLVGNPYPSPITLLYKINKKSGIRNRSNCLMNLSVTTHEQTQVNLSVVGLNPFMCSLLAKELLQNLVTCFSKLVIRIRYAEENKIFHLSFIILRTQNLEGLLCKPSKSCILSMIRQSLIIQLFCTCCVEDFSIGIKHVLLCINV